MSWVVRFDVRFEVRLAALLREGGTCVGRIRSVARTRDRNGTIPCGRRMMRHAERAKCAFVVVGRSVCRLALGTPIGVLAKKNSLLRRNLIFGSAQRLMANRVCHSLLESPPLHIPLAPLPLQSSAILTASTLAH